MPGIVGVISRKPSDECEQLVVSMMRTMAREPFYTSGTYSAPELGIYAGWVAHVGSFAAEQVFLNETEDVALLFSGECFAGPELRTELTGRGHILGSAAGAWLVHLYEEKGEGFFEALNGIFSGLLIDKRQQRAFLFNDRYGLSRIYWCETMDATYFASEAKALLEVLPASREFNPKGLAQFLRYGCTLDWNTLFRGVQLAPGAALWSIEKGNCRRTQYFSPTKWEEQTPLGEDEFQAAFSEAFPRILAQYFASEVRVGIALTGGLDTRMIMAWLPKGGQRPVCYTFAGTAGETLDARIAAQVAQACGLEHGLVRVSADFFEKFGALVDRTVYATDGSFGALGAHEVYLNALARGRSPLRLTGVFGSEVLRGVSTFKPANFTPGLFHSGLQESLAAEPQAESLSSLHPVTFAAFREIPWNLFGGMAACQSQVVFRTPFLDNTIVGLAYRSPTKLRRSARSAIRLIQQGQSKVSSIPTDRGYLLNGSSVTRALRRCVAEMTFRLDYYYNEGMPQALTRCEPLLQAANSLIPVFGHHKYLHYRRWFRRELAEYLREVTSDESIGRSSLWNPREVRRMAEEHIAGTRNRIVDIGTSLTVMAIERCLLKNTN